MATTYDALATTTLGSNQTSVTFSSINQTYTDLVIVTVGKATTNGRPAYIQVNGDTGTTYSDRSFGSSGSAVSAGANSSRSFVYIGALSSDNQGMNVTHVLNYANTTTFKNIFSRENDPSVDGTWVSFGMWRSTAAINSVTILCTTMATGTNITLYGIKAGTL